MAGIGDGYVGTAEDSARIRRMDKKRQEQRKQFEDAQKLRQERIEKAGIRKFDTASTEVLDFSALFELLIVEQRLKFQICRPLSMHSRMRQLDLSPRQSSCRKGQLCKRG
jgi:protein FAM50